MRAHSAISPASRVEPTLRHKSTVRSQAAATNAAPHRYGASRPNSANRKPAARGPSTRAKLPTDSTGEPNGETPGYPQALLLLDKLIPPPSPEEEMEFFQRLLDYGILPTLGSRYRKRAEELLAAERVFRE